MAINRSAAYRPAALIPVYNHPATVEAVVSTLIRQKIPVIVVDDGSDAPAREACDRCARLGATVLHRKINGGKGAALITGFRAAAKSGFTHVIQIDADGQHDHIRDTCIPTFIAFNIPIMICAILMSQVL